MKNIQPIISYYKEQRFRSRTEAKWAVYFDEVGITYEYEPEGYILSDGNTYLPDFYLPKFGDCDGGAIAEVKHVGGDFTKAITLAYSTNTELLLLEGNPTLHPIIIYNPTHGNYRETDELDFLGYKKHEQWFPSLEEVLTHYNKLRKYPTIYEGFDKLQSSDSYGFCDGYPMTEKILCFGAEEYRMFYAPGYDLESKNYLIDEDEMPYVNAIKTSLKAQFGKN